MSGGFPLFGGGSRGQTRHLIEFKAGKMTLKEDKMVYPDKRKGLVYIYQSDEMLTHFCWKDRTTGIVEDDLIIFPGEGHFKRVPQCTTGRVFLLKLKSPGRKFFFWLQEPSVEKDEFYRRRVNELLNGPPGFRGGPNFEGGFQTLLANMNQQQLRQLLEEARQIDERYIVYENSRHNRNSDAGSSSGPPAPTSPKTTGTLPKPSGSRASSRPSTTASSSGKHQDLDKASHHQTQPGRPAEAPSQRPAPDAASGVRRKKNEEEEEEKQKHKKPKKDVDDNNSG